MAIALTALPLEVLHTICKCLKSHLDVANFRLVCRAFGDIGLKFLIPMVTVATTAESIARLRAISLHPVLRHHVSSVTFLINVLYPDTNYHDWRSRVPIKHNLRDTGGLYYYWYRSWKIYKKLLSGQRNAFKALGPARDVEDACQRFTNLDHLWVTELLYEDHLGRNQTYTSLLKWIPAYNANEYKPFYPFSAASSYTGLPGVKPLKTFLRVMTSSKVRKLTIEVLDVGFFDGYETRDASHMRGGLSHVRDLILCLCVNEDNRWESVLAGKRILSKNRLRDFLCSAPNLENIHLVFDSSWYLIGPRCFHVKAANILPGRHTWPHLRSFQIDSIQIVASHFLSFLDCHKSTLKRISLKDCLIVNDPDQGSEAPRSRWSDLFVPLVTSDLLDTLSLWGDFRNSEGGYQDADPGVQEDYICMQDLLQDVELSVARAMAIVICSREFDSFLRSELADRGDLKAEAVKIALVKDLTGEPPAQSSQERSKVHVKRYSNYLKSFAMLRGNVPNWGAWWEHPRHSLMFTAI